MTDEKPTGRAAGGHARAKLLSAEERSEIAKKAAAERWRTDIPKATHAGQIRIGDAEIQCYVLDSGDRVISTRGMMRALGRAWRGRKYTGTELPVFAEANNLKPFIDNDLAAVLSPLEIRTDKGAKSEAFKAEVLPGICRLYLTARRANVLTHPQMRVAEQCEILQNGLSELGILGLVDEATGYQYVRDREALQKILDKYLTDEWAKWTKMFPDEFYRHLFRLKNIEYPSGAGGRKPGYVGHWTNDIVYSRLAPGVLDELKQKNPRTPNGSGRKRKHHQHLTREYGHPVLVEHLSNITFLMSTCADWDDFKRRLDLAKPKLGNTLEMDI